jgi:homoserine O-acetyltransferase/O-succinyltransferase
MNKESKQKTIVVPEDFSFGSDKADGLKLDCGKTLSPVNIRYETYGELNTEKNNAILLLHALTGDAHVAGYHDADDKKPGWWDEMVGSGKPFDTDKYFIVCSNIIGGCQGSTGPASKNPETGKPYGMTFPVITIADMVRAQYRLMQHLAIEKWLAISGGSMGGMQALQWSAEYPEAVGSVIAIATTSKLSPQSIAFDWVGRQAIMSDPKWNKGAYGENVPDQGLAIARMVGHITYLSDESMEQKFGRRLQQRKDYSFDFDRNFQVESYLEYQGQRFVERFDANSYLYISRAMDYFDLSAKGSGDLTKSLKEVSATFLIVSFSSDWLFPSKASREIVKALRNNNIDVSYCDIQSEYGHDAFLLESETLGELISGFLNSQFAKVKSSEEFRVQSYGKNK